MCPEHCAGVAPAQGYAAGGNGGLLEGGKLRIGHGGELTGGGAAQCVLGVGSQYGGIVGVGGQTVQHDAVCGDLSFIEGEVFSAVRGQRDDPLIRLRPTPPKAMVAVVAPSAVGEKAVIFVISLVFKVTFLLPSRSLPSVEDRVKE